MSTLNVFVVQSDLHWHDADANLKEFDAVIRSLDAPTDLIVLPEMFTTGFTMDAASQAEDMNGRSMQWLATAAERAGAAVCGSLVIEDGSRYFNRFVLMHPDGKHQTYDKRHLFRMAGEGESYSAGDSVPVIELKGFRLRPMICYDLRFPVWSRRTAESDFDLLLYVANWPSPRHHAWETLLRARAIENQCYVVGVNRSGKDGNGVPYSGGSAIIDYLGHDLLKLGEEADTGSAKLDYDNLCRFREKFPFAVDADEFRLSTD